MNPNQRMRITITNDDTGEVMRTLIFEGDFSDSTLAQYAVDAIQEELDTSFNLREA